MRKLIMAAVFGALLIPGQALTLGLGDIEVSSALNQELKAEIELRSTSEGDAETLLVKLASREEFARAGLDRPFMLGSLKFEAVSEGDRTYIKVTTPKPVREPFLNFLVEVDWPQGHLIREYTILLDPPVFTGRSTPVNEPNLARPSMDDSVAVNTQQNRPVASSGNDGFRASRVPVAVPEIEPEYSEPEITESEMEESSSAMEAQNDEAESNYSQSVASRPTSTPTAMDDGRFRVRAGNTAWSLAESMRPDETISVEQMMLALLRANPEAFINENVNGLKQGYILRVPDTDSVNSIELTQAKTVVREQNALWREYQQALASGTPIAEIQNNRTASGDGSSFGSSTSGQLAIVGIDSSTSMGVDPTAMSAEELRNELALTAERLETERLEKEGLQNRLESLQSQLDGMKGLVSIEDKDLAQMQSTQEPAKVAPTKAKSAESIAKPATTKPAAPAEKKVAQPKPKPAKPFMPEPKPEPGLLDNPLILIAGGVVLLILIVLAVLIIRRRKAAADELSGSIDSDAIEAFLDSDDDSEEENHDATVVLQAPELDKTVIVDTATVVTEAITPEAPEETPGEASADDSSVEPEAPPAPPAEEETDDVMAEADVYLAYGIFQQAEELLQNAIQEKPDKEMYRVKLCETLYAAKNAEAFEAAAKELHDKIGGEETAGWLKVASLGKDLCPGNDLFEGVDVAANVETAADQPEGVAMDIALEDDDEAGETEVDFSLDDPDEFELPDLDDAVSEESTEATAEAAEPDELEFDLSDDSSDSSGDSEAAEEFSLDMDSSELDLDMDIEEPSSESAESDLELDLDASADLDDSATDSADADSGDDLDLSMDLDDSGLDIDDSEQASEAESEDDLDISMDLDDSGLDLGDSEQESEEDSEDDLDISMDLDDSGLDLDDSGLEGELDSEDDSLEIEMDLDDSSLDSSDLESASDDLDISMDLEDSGLESEQGSDDDLDISMDLEDSGLEDADDLDISMEELDVEDSDDSLDISMDLEDSGLEDADDLDISMEELDVEDSKDSSDISMDLDSSAEDSPELEVADDDFSDDSLDSLLEDTSEADSSDESTDDGFVDDSLDFGDDDSDDATTLDNTSEEDVDFSSLDDVDEVSTKLDLARAYIDMGAHEDSRSILEEVVAEGNDAQKKEANDLLVEINK